MRKNLLTFAAVAAVLVGLFLVYAWRLDIEYGHGDQLYSAFLGVLLIAAGATPLVVWLRSKREDHASKELARIVGENVVLTVALIAENKRFGERLEEIERQI